MFIAAGFALVLAVALAVFLGYVDFDYANRTAAYDSAPSCASASEMSRCRYVATATVIKKWTDSNGDPVADVRFEGLGDKTYSAYFDKAFYAQWQALPQGSPVTAELWQGTPTRVGDLKTRGNPDLLPNAGATPVIIFGTVAVLLVIVLAWLWNLNRRASTQRAR